MSKRKVHKILHKQSVKPIRYRGDLAYEITSELSIACGDWGGIANENWRSVTCKDCLKTRKAKR